MTQNEFLDKLRNALENELSGSAVQDNVAYYSSYIMEEMRKGRTESEVVGESWRSVGHCPFSHRCGRKYRGSTRRV
ncbi:HAAS signaling domain-containing protein [[Clostridium] hylemonae]|uniref:HAAS signaling domain-containing protein n=1 Tax=[Clostridium] hylemonae TaxID=89153 RepID=UPI003A7F4201